MTAETNGPGREPTQEMIAAGRATWIEFCEAYGGPVPVNTTCVGPLWRAMWDAAQPAPAPAPDADGLMRRLSDVLCNWTDVTDDEQAVIRDARALIEQQARELAAMTAERDSQWASAQAYKLDLAHARLREADLVAARACIAAADVQLSRVLHELAGAASLCWEPKPTGVFHSTQACEFVAAATAELRALLRDDAARAAIKEPK